ncbi:MAG: hypothetical protein IANPNBLG_02906 [Bryobacteraceae bacterium]|nr:hypothetical protein [Bryobacteraceae bacterium]
MIVLRKAQLEAIQKPAMLDFSARLVAFIQEECPGQVDGLPADVLRKRVLWAQTGAQRLGLTWENSITLFVACMFQRGPNFFQHPSIRRIFQDPSILPNDRMHAVMDSVTREEWAEIESRRDDSLWERAR